MPFGFVLVAEPDLGPQFVGPVGEDVRLDGDGFPDRRFGRVAAAVDDRTHRVITGRARPTASGREAAGLSTGTGVSPYARATYSRTMRCVVKNEPFRAMAERQTAANASGRP